MKSSIYSLRALPEAPSTKRSRNWVEMNQYSLHIACGSGAGSPGPAGPADNYGLSTGRWTKKQIREFRQRDLFRRRKEFMEDYASGLPRGPDEEDWLEYMAAKEESKTRTTEPVDTSAFTVGKS
jgi:hypothetical protein